MVQVSKEMMKELDDVSEHHLENSITPVNFILSIFNKDTKYPNIYSWYQDFGLSISTRQLMLIKHIWLNEKQFEEEKPKKYIVQALDYNTEPWYVNENAYGIKSLEFCVYSSAFRFDTREEAEKYSTPQSEIIEVEE